MRRNIYDILNTRNIDIKKEYSRIYAMFYFQPYYNGFYEMPLSRHISQNFTHLDKNLIHRCLSLEDFDGTYGFRFVEQPQDFDIEYLVSFAEYVTNFTFALLRYKSANNNCEELCNVINHIRDCMEDVGYQLVNKKQIVIYVAKNPTAISVAESTNSELSYSVLEYNHYRMREDLIGKKSILKNMADDIESERKILTSINKNFTSDLFQLLNKFIRHDNSENSYIANMSRSDIECIYDDIYQMWLLAKLQLEHYKRNDVIHEVISRINEN